MNRVRCLVNAELDATLPNGKTNSITIGSGTYIEVTRVDTFKDKDETFADITLADGSVMYGVLWGSEYWENHNAPQFEKEEETVDDEQELEPASEEDVERDE